MSEDAPHATGVIGPNAILQLLPVLDRLGGPERRHQILAEAGIFHLPDGKAMIPETDAARLHHRLRQVEPDLAPALSAHAGLETANYILRHRIPTPIQWILKALPKGPSARLLSQAIAKHAWTFVGSGRFDVLDPWTFEIHDNPLIKGETSDHCLCHWHSGVFAQLYQTLVTEDCICRETTCGAQSPETPCHFKLSVKP